MMHKSVKEFSVTTLEVAGFGPAFEAVRLPYGKESKSEMYPGFNSAFEVKNGEPILIYQYGTAIKVDEADVKLISALVKRGDEHAKVLRGVTVWCDITAPRYWWQEMDTYRLGAERLSSESTMHIEGRGLSEDELVEMKENLSEGHMQRRIWMFSYQTLRRIYQQRKNHRLPQWRKFCEWIETLPLCQDFITIE